MCSLLHSARLYNCIDNLPESDPMPLTNSSLMNVVMFLALAIAPVGLVHASDLYVFRDSLRANSPESKSAVKASVRPWPEGHKATVQKVLEELAGNPWGRALLGHAAANGSISLYYTPAPGPAIASAAYRQLQLSDDAIHDQIDQILPSRYTLKIIAHELTRAARRNNEAAIDPHVARTISDDPEWEKLIAPRIAALRALLAKQHLDATAAARIPYSGKPDALQTKIEDATGLPSAYSAKNSEVAMAEIVAHMIDRKSFYIAPPDLTKFLNTRLTAKGAWRPQTKKSPR